MLISCPECKKQVSDQAEFCPDCGFPLKDNIPKIKEAFNKEVESLLKKIKPVNFTCDAPHERVCVKCGKPLFRSNNNYRQMCQCKSALGEAYPSVEVDYSLHYGAVDTYIIERLLYIHQNCVIQNNIGDVESQEYKENETTLYRDKERREASLKRKIYPIAYDYTPTYSPPTRTTFTHRVTPKCPICGSTSLTKISTMKKAAKIATFGIFGMGDNGKTWKCNSCGSKF